MLVATFGPTTGWSGKTITNEADVFTLEGCGSAGLTDACGSGAVGRPYARKTPHSRATSGEEAEATEARIDQSAAVFEGGLADWALREESGGSREGRSPN